MIEIIPAIDLLDGRAVRLKKGDYKQVTDYGSPLDAAKYWQDQGAHRIHIVDLNGAKEGKLVHLSHIEQIAESVDVDIQFGGGIRSWDSLECLFEMGVKLVIMGTAAIKNPDLLIQALNTYKERILLGLDAKDDKISVEGWLEQSTVTTEELLQELSQYGLRRFVYTDISRDGILSGPDLTGVIRLCQKFPKMKCLLSGGISSLDDIKAVHQEAHNLDNLEGIISGRALYEKKFILRDALNILHEIA